MLPSLHPRPAIPVALLVALAVLTLPGAARADLPDPGYSSCTFPERLPAVRTPVVIEVTVAAASGPLAGAEVTAEILVDSGSLADGQATTASAVSGQDGRATVEFPDGILGGATLRIRTRADGVDLCTSEPYSLFTAPKISVHLREHGVSPCASPPEVPCAGYATGGKTATGDHVYLVAAQIDPDPGSTASPSASPTGRTRDPRPVSTSRPGTCAPTG